MKIIKAEPWIILFAALLTATLIGALILMAEDKKLIRWQQGSLVERDRIIRHLNDRIDTLEHRRDDRSDMCKDVLEDNGFIVMEGR